MIENIHNMSVLKVCFVTYATIATCFGIILPFLIIFYIRRKPEGSKTVFDSFVTNYLLITVFGPVIYTYVVIALIDLNLPGILVCFITVLGYFLVYFWWISLTSVNVLVSLLVLKPELIEKDSTFIFMVNEIVMIGIVIISSIIDNIAPFQFEPQVFQVLQQNQDYNINW